MAAIPTPEPAVPQELIDKFKPKRIIDVKLRNYMGHPGQEALCTSPLKRKIVRAGRRGGKTTGAAILALLAFLKGKRVLYAAPTIDQVSKFWKEIKRSLADGLAYRAYYKNETEHIIELLGTETRIRAKTAWNADTLRGDYADLLILDEWQMMDETAWTEVGAPMLIDRNGDVVFIYTPPSLETRSSSKATDPQHAAKMYKKYKANPLWLCVHFPSSANPHISEEGLEEVSRNMTSLAYRQEILAEDTEEIPGALWTRKIIEDSRVDKAPEQFRRIVVGIDPSGGNTTEVGIMTAGEGEDGHYYVLQDDSMTATRPKEWAQRAIWTYYARQADRIIAERNYGGDMVSETIRNIDENVSYHDVSASRGKLVRAEPVLALFQQKKMHLVGEFPELEEELCSYTASPGQKSPNRLDAMVWCGIELSGSGALGLLDLFKSGRAQEIADKPPVGKITKVASSTMGAVATNDETPSCTGCGNKILQIIGGGQLRCQNCGHQQWPNGVKPEFQRPLGGRRIELEK